jgi:hypothetical protein
MKTQSNSTAGSGCSSHDLLAVAGWIVGNDTGSSSEWLAATAIAGSIPESQYAPSYPRDASDLGRCIRLIEAAPSVRNALPLLAAACEKWDALVGKWDALTILHNETPEKDSYRWRVVTSQMEMLFRPANSQADRPQGSV